MERVAFIVERTGERIDCLLNPDTVVVRRSAGLRESRCQSSARPSAWRLKLPALRRSQRMIPQEVPFAFFSSHPTSASAPGVGCLRQVFARS